jgi:hypothetical protein
MNKPNNMKGRQRGRNGGKPRPMGGGGGRNPNFDGGGRMRGNAQQLMEKYLSLARDASSAGDRVLAENYFQHADHYYRVLNARFEQQQNNGQRRFQDGGQQNFDRQGGYNQGGYNQGGYGQDRGFDGDQQPRFDQPHHHQPEQGAQPNQPAPAPQQQPQPQPQQHRQPEPQPVETRPAENEIGLPPGILGMAPAPQPPQEPQGEARNEGESEDRSRHQGRRRRGRGDRAFANAGE